MPAHAGSCATAGVLGTAVGVMGTLQAHLVLSMLLGLQASAAVQAGRSDQLAPASNAGPVAASPATAIFGTPTTASSRTQAIASSGTPTTAGSHIQATARLLTLDFRTLRIGGFSFASAPEPNGPVFRFIAPESVNSTDITIDLRSSQEAPILAFPSSLRMTANDIDHLTIDNSPGQRIVLCCRSGVRAWRAASTLRARGATNLALIALGD